MEQRERMLNSMIIRAKCIMRGYCKTLEHHGYDTTLERDYIVDVDKLFGLNE